jgi:hypothetical protein
MALPTSLCPFFPVAILFLFFFSPAAVCNSFQGCLKALNHISEDCDVDQLADPRFGSPINHILPKLIEKINSTSPRVRELSLNTISTLLYKRAETARPGVVDYLAGPLQASVDRILAAVYAHRNDVDVAVRKNICKVIVLITDQFPDTVETSMPNIIQFMIEATNDPDPDVSLEACEIWLTVVKQEYCVRVLDPFVLR